MTVLYAAFLVFAAVVSVCDAVTGAVPRYLFVLYAVFLVAYCALFIPESLTLRIIGTAAAASFFLAVRKFSGGGLGLADVWFAGVSAGTFPFTVWILAAALGCTLAAVFMLAAGKKKAPLLPFLAAGFAAVITANVIKGFIL